MSLDDASEDRTTFGDRIIASLLLMVVAALLPALGASSWPPNGVMEVIADVTLVVAALMAAVASLHQFRLAFTEDHDE